MKATDSISQGSTPSNSKRNQTNKFWRIVEEHHDSHKECSEWLEENAPELIFRKEDL